MNTTRVTGVAIHSKTSSLSLVNTSTTDTDTV